MPQEHLLNSSREILSSNYLFFKDLNSVLYAPKKGKALLLVMSSNSSIFQDTDINKIEIISSFNITKSGVDDLDEKCVFHCTAWRTRRRAMTIFFIIWV